MTDQTIRDMSPEGQADAVERLARVARDTWRDAGGGPIALAVCAGGRIVSFVHVRDDDKGVDDAVDNAALLAGNLITCAGGLFANAYMGAGHSRADMYHQIEYFAEIGIDRYDAGLEEH